MDVYKNISKLNWLRASVLGANDGIVSVASIIFGVAGAINSTSTILTAGVAGMVAGALSMASGEYVSVSTQRDSEKIIAQKHESVADEELFTNPWHAAFASGASFIAGAIIPILFTAFSPEKYRIYFTFISVVFALGITGYLSAHVGGANKYKATIRVILGGTFAMLITYFVGVVFGKVGL